MPPPNDDSRSRPPPDSGATRYDAPPSPAADPDGTRYGGRPQPGAEETRYGPPAADPEGTRYRADASTDAEGTRYPSPGDGREETGATRSDPQAVSEFPRAFGSYELLEKVAEGGMGVVYKARQLSTGRVVALKLIRRGSFARPQDVERFRVETRAAAALDHPGIVPIYDVGEAGGQPYYTMAFVVGGSLQQLLAGGPLLPKAAAGLVRQLAEAVQYAHGHGVIHRDIKPHNVLLQRGETAAPGLAAAAVRPPGGGTDPPPGILQPRLADFGLARLVEEGGGVSVTGEALGTPSYMPPEQASGDRPRVGRATDVYSLGAVLYCCLTGRPPFQSANQLETLRQVREEEPLPPGRVNPAVPVELQTVCLKCLEKDPGRRYGSAAALAEDLRRFCAGEPILAVPAGPLTRAAKWARRRPAVAGLLAALVLVASAGVGAFAAAYREALHQAERADAAYRQALQQAERADAEAETAKALLAAAREADRRRVRARVEQLATAAPPAVPHLLKELRSEGPEALAHLRELWRASADRRRLRFALALLPEDPGLRHELAAAMLDADDPREALLLLDGLKPFAADLKEDLWWRARNPATSANARFRALVALAALDPGDPRWGDAARPAVEQLLGSNSLYLGDWAKAMRPASAALTGPLAEVFRGTAPAAKRRVAAEVLADYARADAVFLADLAADADPEQFALLIPPLARHREEAVRHFRELLARELKPKPPAMLPARGVAAAGVAEEIGAAGGFVAEGFALCQALPLGRFERVTADLAAAGYRPAKFRPYAAGGAVRVAAVWVRDGRGTRALHGLTAEEAGRRDVEMRALGFQPADAAEYSDRGGAAEPRFAVLWLEAGRDPATRLRLAVPVGRVLAEDEPLDEQGLVPVTFHAYLPPRGGLCFSGVLQKGTAAWNTAWKYKEGSFRSLHRDKVPVDVSLTERAEDFGVARRELSAWLGAVPQQGPGDLPWAGLITRWHKTRPPRARLDYAGLWRAEPAVEAVLLTGWDPDTHIARCKQLASEGYHPVALSVPETTDEQPGDVASVWHRPLVTEADRLALARRQASAAAALLLLGDAEAAWPVLRHAPTPDARSYLVRDLAPRGVGAAVLAKRLGELTDASARRALVLALGEYTAEQLPAELRSALVPKLLGWYRSDPDAGVHGAVDWLLRHATEGSAPRKYNWGQREALEAIDRELAGKPPAPGQGWYVAKGRFTMAVVAGPVEFWMGSPATEAGRQEREERHRRRIGRSFAVATKAVTVEQFRRFLRDNPPAVSPDYSASDSPESECPINGVDWYTAAKFCRWLSEQEGVPEDQMCYPRMRDIKEEMTLYPDYLSRTGYRLPTEAEWEYACRAGSETAYHFGGAVELLPRYAWFDRNAGSRSWPVGRKRPNDLGLFDTHGNVWAWCQESMWDYEPARRGPVEDREDIMDVRFKVHRAVRGGSLTNQAPEVRCATRTGCRPSDRNATLGLRVARTYR